jgi:RNA polymerase sigma-70 factor, ECF subfamily
MRHDMDKTPFSLLERLRAPDDAEAWNRFAALAVPFLFDSARRWGLQDADAADVVQDVFAVLAQKLPKFHYDPAHSFRSWLRTILLNKCRDRRRRLTCAVVRPAGIGLPEVAAPDPGDVFADGEYHRALAGRALHLMQAEFAETTWRACWEQVVNGRSAGEVARELKITVNVAYLARSRVLARLREELAGML